MILEMILLGLLRRPGSGSEIRRAFETAIGHFWAAELSQIYPALKRMRREGWLTMKLEHSDRGPPRKAYAITAAGRAVLRAWIAQPPHVGPERNDWLAQAWFLDELKDGERALGFFTALRGELARDLAALEAIEAHWKAGDARYPEALPDEAFYPQLTLRLGLKRRRAALEWAEECLALMEARRRPQRTRGKAGKP